MKDNEIIKALNYCCGNDEHDEECNEKKCYQAVMPEMRNGDLRFCRQWLIKDALDLIKRQQEEVEKLKAENLHHRKTIAENAQRGLEVTLEEIEKARAETIEEFAERAKEEFRANTDNNGDINSCFVPIIIDDIATEMIEKGR